MTQFLIIKKGMLILVLGIIMTFAGSICVHASGPVPSPIIDYSFKTNPNAVVNRKALIVLVSFNDRALTYTNDQEWSNDFFGKNGATLRNFYDEESAGKTIFGPAEESYGTANDGVIKVHLNKNHPGTEGLSLDQQITEIRMLITQLVANLDSYINFKSFDNNNDGKISPDELIITYVFAGFEQSSTDKLFPCVYACTDTKSLTTAFDGVTFEGFTFVYSGEIQQDTKYGTYRATIRTYCHEFGHCLGLQDLYPWVKLHSLMGAGDGRLPGQKYGEIPEHLDPYSKIKLGYIKPTNANRSGIYTVNSFKAASGKNVLRINTKNAKEYFLIENRQLSGFDAALYPTCGYGGIAIWHIDETKPLSRGGVDLEVAKMAKSGAVILDISPYHFYAQGSDYTLFDDTDKANTLNTAKLNDGSNSGIKVEVLSTSSHSMNVKITAPEIYIDTNEKGPKICSFTASTNEIAVGESVNLKAVLKENIAPISEVTFKIIKDGGQQSEYVSAVLSSQTSIGNYTYEAVFFPEDYETLKGEGKLLFYLESATDIYGNKSKYTGYSVAVNVNNSTSNVNIAKQKPVTASRELPYQPASNAVNGIISIDNNADKWCTGVGYGNGSWLRVYLGGTKTVNRWKVVHEKASGSVYDYLFTKKYRLQASDDGENWRDIDIVDNSLGLSITDRPVAPFKCSYVRLYIDEADRDNCARICEFQVYNDTITGIDANFDGKNTEQISGFKRYAGALHYTSTPLYSTQVTGYISGTQPECAVKTGEAFHSYNSSISVAGTDNSTYGSYCYFMVYDDLNILVNENTCLSYWMLPKNTNGRYIGVDIEFTNGQCLRATSAVDQNGYSMHPETGRGTVNKWDYVRSNIGRWCNGLTIKRIMVAYDQRGNSGQFKGYIDDIVINDELEPSLYKGIIADFEGSISAPNNLLKPLGVPDHYNKVAYKDYVTNPLCGMRTGEQSNTGNGALIVKGTASNVQNVPHYAYFYVYDNLNIPVTATTNLSYWILPQDENGRHVGVDIEFTDGSVLRATAATDQNGTSMHPYAGNGVLSGRGTVGQWNFISSKIGDWCEGKVIKSIMAAYDQPNVSGQYSAYIDDIIIK